MHIHTYIYNRHTYIHYIYTRNNIHITYHIQQECLAFYLFIWQVETLERAMQEHSGRLLLEEKGLAERQQLLSEACAASEASAQRAERMASEAAERARQAPEEQRERDRDIDV